MNQARDALPGHLAVESRFQLLTRVGFAARGLLYIVIAALLILTGRTEDVAGALEYVGRGTGKYLLAILGAGMAVYGLWRLSDLAFGIEHPGGDGKALRKRGAAGFIGLVYLYLAYKAFNVLLAGRTGSMDAREQADTILDLPGGRLVLWAAAAVLAAAGAAQIHKAVECRFMSRLDEGASSRDWIKWMGRIGYAARGVIFFLVAFLIGRAAADRNSNEAGGMEQALDLLGGPLLVPVAAGLLLFGLFSLLEARYRRVHRPPPPERVAEKVRDTVAGR